MQEISKKLGKNLKKVRAKKKLSQGTLARLLEVDKGYVSNIENGKKNPTLATIQRLADALGVAADGLNKYKYTKITSEICLPSRWGERRKLFTDKNFGEYPPIEEVRNRVGELKNIWSDINKDDKVFKLLIKVIGVTLPRDLEMHIFGVGLNVMSNPLIMPIYWQRRQKVYR